MAELNNCDMDSMAQEVKNIYYLAICKKSLLIVALEL